MRIKINDDIYFNKETIIGVSISELQARLNNLLEEYNNIAELLSVPEGISEDIYQLIVIENDNRERIRAGLFCQIEKIQRILSEIETNGS